MAITDDDSIVTKGILRKFYYKIADEICCLLNTKVNKEDGKGLSEENFTTEDKEKLDSLENYTLPQADTDTLGGVKLGYSQNGKNYPVLKDENGNIYVAVPWVEYQLQQASAETLGGIKTGYEQQGQNYPVDTDIEGNAYVTVPWSDTGYQPATPQTDGLMSAQDKGRLDDLYEWYQKVIQGSATVLIKRS